MFLVDADHRHSTAGSTCVVLASGMLWGSTVRVRGGIARFVPASVLITIVLLLTACAGGTDTRNAAEFELYSDASGSPTPIERVGVSYPDRG